MSDEIKLDQKALSRPMTVSEGVMLASRLSAIVTRTALVALDPAEREGENFNKNRDHILDKLEELHRKMVALASGEELEDD